MDFNTIVEVVSLQFLSGPAFLLAYAGLTISFVAIYLYLRHLCLKMTVPEDLKRGLTVSEVAYLRYGGRHALGAALLHLEGSGALEVTPQAIFARSGCYQAKDGLESAILYKARRGTDPKQLGHSPSILRALDELKSSLKARLWTLPAAREAQLDRCLIVMALILGVMGGVRLMIGLADHRPVLYLLAEMGIIVVTILCLAATVSGLPLATRAHLKAQRKLHAALASSARSLPRGLKRGDAAIALALFGIGILPSLARREPSLLSRFFTFWFSGSSGDGDSSYDGGSSGPSCSSGGSFSGCGG